MDRRAYGTGAVYQRKRDGRWVASIAMGWTERGTRRRRARIVNTKAAARIALRQMLTESQTPTTGGRPTIKTWADQWLDMTASTLRPTAWQANRSQVTRWIVPTIGHKRLDRLTPGDRRAVTRALEAAGRAQGTITRCDAVLGKMLRDAIIEGHTVPQAVTLVSTGAPSESGRVAIPLPDALAVLAAATTRGDASRWVAALLQGMRPAECLGLTWDRVDLDAETLDVSWQLKALPYRILRDRASGFRTPRGYTARQVEGALHLVRPKTARGRRIIPLVPWMRDALLAWQQTCPPSRTGLVWPRADGRPQSDREDRAAWAALTDTAQVAHVEDTHGRRYALYEARHTTATLLSQAGVDDATIRAIMGHATILSTRAYLHTDDARTRAALESVADRLALH